MEDAPQEPCLDSVFSVRREDYGPEYTEHLLQQYHRYIESVWYIGDTKQKVNSYFLTMNTVLLAALGVSFANVNFISGAFNAEPWRVAVPFIGVVISIIWWGIIYSYRQRTKMKLHIIKCIEERMPLAPYTVESEMIHGRYPGISYAFFRMSLTVPWVFVALYLLLMIFI